MSDHQDDRVLGIAEPQAPNEECANRLERIGRMDERRVSRRRFIGLAGAAVGATAVAASGLASLSWQEPTVEFLQPTYGSGTEMSSKILVAYASRHGSTSQVAETVGRTLASSGATVDVRRVQEVTDVSGYRAVVVGSAINGGKWLPEAASFVKANQDSLKQIPTAYFLVCMMMARGTEQDRGFVANYLEPERALVRPVAEGRFAGALWPSKHPLIFEGLGLRFFLRYLGLKEGDYRNWDAVHAWAENTRPLLLQ